MASATGQNRKSLSMPLRPVLLDADMERGRNLRTPMILAQYVILCRIIGHEQASESPKVPRLDLDGLDVRVWHPDAAWLQPFGKASGI